MSTATLRLSTPLSEARVKQAAPRKSWIVRLYWAVAEARMRAAMREIARHRHLIPEDVVKKAGYQATISDDAAFPFTR